MATALPLSPFNPPGINLQDISPVLRERHGRAINNWHNRLYLGDNLHLMHHLLDEFRGQIDLVYIDPPFASQAEYKKRIFLKSSDPRLKSPAFKETQYYDIWKAEDYLHYISQRLILIKELLSPAGVIYIHCDPGINWQIRGICENIFGSEHFVNEIIWHYTGGGRSRRYFSRKHDTIFIYSKSGKYIFNADNIRIPYAKTSSYAKSGIVSKAGKQYLPHPSGTVPDDVWDIPIINPLSSERTDYPTQKPEALIRRILLASTNPGSLVLDCFMGSGTTQAVAMKLGRRFIGMDNNLCAVETAVNRLVKIISEEKPIQTAASPELFLNFQVYHESEPYTSAFKGRADIYIDGSELIIQAFYPLKLLEKLHLENADDWRRLVNTVAVDWNYDGKVFQPDICDTPGKNRLVKGRYPLPETCGYVKLKITDLLSESYETILKA